MARFTGGDSCDADDRMRGGHIHERRRFAFEMSALPHFTGASNATE
jgi:hypothetical protein